VLTTPLNLTATFEFLNVITFPVLFLLMLNLISGVNLLDLLSNTSLVIGFIFIAYAISF